MKKEFSKKWAASSQPRKQRKYRANADIQTKRKFLAVNLAKDLRTKHNTRNIEVIKGDEVKILRGKFKGKSGKISKVFTKISKIFIEGIQTKKMDGSKVAVKLQPSNMQITKLNLNDSRRIKSKSKEVKKGKKPVIKETKQVKEKKQ